MESENPDPQEVDHVANVRQSFERMTIDSRQPVSMDEDGPEELCQSSSPVTVRDGKSVALIVPAVKRNASAQSGRLPQAPRDYLELPPIPPEAKTSAHFYAFGWTFVDYYKVLSDISAQVFKHSTPSATKGLTGLKRYTRYEGLYLFPTPWEENDTPPPYLDSDGNGDDVEECKWMVAIAYTASDYLYRRRPSLKVYNWLNKLLPGEPRWVPDYFPKEDWHCHYIT